MEPNAGKRKVWPNDYSPEGSTFGISCPKCGCKRTAVRYVRNREGGMRIRQRICGNCGKSFRTYEHT
jgi:transcription elongation factor Elf1